MCYSIAEGGLRCDGHAEKAKNKALEAFSENETPENKLNLAKAIEAWKLTEKGLLALQELADKAKDDDLRRERLEDLERCKRLRDRKLEQAREFAAKKRKETGKPATLKEKLSLAGNPETDTATQMMLARDKNPKVRLAIATNSTDSGVLDLLWTDKEQAVLAAVARNEHADAPALEALFALASKHPGKSIHLALAGNRNCPSSLYLPLATSGTAQIRQHLASKEDVDTRTLDVVATDRFPAARRSAGLSANGSPEMYELLGSQDTESYVRSTVAGNDAAPTDVLKKIADTDPDWQVRQTASETLQRVGANQQP